MNLGVLRFQAKNDLVVVTQTLPLPTCIRLGRRCIWPCYLSLSRNNAAQTKFCPVLHHQEESMAQIVYVHYNVRSYLSVGQLVQITRPLHLSAYIALSKQISFLIHSNISSVFCIQLFLQLCYDRIEQNPYFVMIIYRFIQTTSGGRCFSTHPPTDPPTQVQPLTVAA